MVTIVRVGEEFIATTDLPTVNRYYYKLKNIDDYVNFKRSFMRQKIQTLNYPLEIVKISYFVLSLESLLVWQEKSSCISCAVNNFYGTEVEIWACFGPVGNTEKK
jgi:hypothetical protein